jgi:DNA invertase Pin-like site-specific DNA recombinase
VLLIEQDDRLSRLTEADWRKLRAGLDAKQVRVVALDLPTSWMLTSGDEFTERMFAAVNGMRSRRREAGASARLEILGVAEELLPIETHLGCR